MLLLLLLLLSLLVLLLMMLCLLLLLLLMLMLLLVLLLMLLLFVAVVCVVVCSCGCWCQPASLYTGAWEFLYKGSCTDAPICTEAHIQRLLYRGSCRSSQYSLEALVRQVAHVETPRPQYRGSRYSLCVLFVNVVGLFGAGSQQGLTKTHSTSKQKQSAASIKKKANKTNNDNIYI